MQQDILQVLLICRTRPILDIVAINSGSRAQLVRSIMEECWQAKQEMNTWLSIRNKQQQALRSRKSEPLREHQRMSVTLLTNTGPIGKLNSFYLYYYQLFPFMYRLKKKVYETFVGNPSLFCLGDKMQITFFHLTETRPPQVCEVCSFFWKKLLSLTIKD